MKNYQFRFFFKSLAVFILITFLCLAAGTSLVKADVIFSSDFSKGTFDSLGWAVTGDWTIKDYGVDKPDLANNPGPVAVFAANGKTVGTLIKKFDPIVSPSSLTLTFDGGYGWGKNSHVQHLQVMLVDADGNGYIFGVARAKATWGAQWAVVTKYGFNDPMTWASASIDTTQAAIHDGGGLRTFTITRDATGKWTFSGAGWTGEPLTFTDTTTTSFSQVVLRGARNTDEIVYGKVSLEASK